MQASLKLRYTYIGIYGHVLSSALKCRERRAELCRAVELRLSTKIERCAPLRHSRECGMNRPMPRAA